MKYQSLFDIWKQSAERFKNRIAFSNVEKTIQITYNQAFREMCFLATKFLDLGLCKGDKVSLFAINFPRWLIIEQAIISIGGICVAKSSEIDKKELEYVFKNSDSIALIIDNKDFLIYLLKEIPEFFKKLKFVLYTDEKVEDIEANNLFYLSDFIDELKNNPQFTTVWKEEPESIAYINYTSGTSAMPKGAMLPNNGMAYVVEELQKFNDIKEDKTFVVTFPLSSAGGKSFNLLCFSCGCTIVYTQYKNFYEAIDKIKPEYLHCAPKIIQTMHSKLVTVIKKKGYLFEKLFDFMFALSKIILYLERNFFYKNKLNCIKPFFYNLKYIIDKHLYKKIRNTLFADYTTIFVGSAHLAKPLEDFFEIMNIPLIQHYGLTETTGLAVSNTRQSQQEKPYTVGKAFNGTTIKIVNPDTFEELPVGEIGLILLGGIEITKGYYKNLEATQNTILPNGFLNTADLGYVDKEGYLVVLSRYDDVIVMSNGYNVYTPLLENEAKDSQYINQIIIVGHGKPYLVSLIVLNIDEYKNWCSQNNIHEKSPNKNNVFKEFLIEHINEKIKRKSEYRYYEKIKKIFFLEEEFTTDNGLLTGTLKVKYKAVCNKYQTEIESLYKEI